MECVVDAWDGWTESGTLEVEESKGGTGGKGRGKFRDWVGDSGCTLSAVD